MHLGYWQGLAATMYLLGKFDALPALPISILLGILAYLLTTALFVPFLAHLTVFHVSSF
jgi:presenilin 1